MAPDPSPGNPSPVPEPPPPLGSWARLYALVAVYHIAVVGVLWLLTALFQLRQPPP